MPLPPPPAGLLAQIKAKKNDETCGPSGSNNKSLLTAIHKRSMVANDAPAEKDVAQNDKSAAPEEGKLYSFIHNTNTFVFDMTSRDATTPRLADAKDNAEIVVPLAPCVYRMTDYTFSKKEPISLSRIVNKLGVLRCLERECGQLNRLITSRIEASTGLDEEELGKSRFMELLSNCGIFQKVSELILPKCNASSYEKAPRVRVEGLSEFLQTVEDLVPALASARNEIQETQTVSFHPGLGELFCPGSKLVCFPDGMEGTPLGVSVVQSWYDEEVNRATNKTKRRFILVVEFIVSVGTELVFVAASEVYPEFHDATRNLNTRDLNHRRLDPKRNLGDATLMTALQERGEFYASVATDNHYLEYHPGSFFPIVGGWANNSTRPLSKSGRVMVDVRRSFQEGHVPIRGSSDGMSDTVKEAMKLFDQSKRTGVAVPFRTAILQEFHRSGDAVRGDSDRHQLWMSWPMLTGFSFTARVWGKLLLSLPSTRSSPPRGTNASTAGDEKPSTSESVASRRPYILGGTGRSGSVSYITFQEKAFDQLVLSEDKKELIRAVARNAGGGGHDSDDESEDDEIGLDVVANKGAASIFLLSGPPGCGKTLTAEAIAELLKKPLYVVTAGDLGITASEVEKSFGGVLDLCSTWDALVLVDEADIFLEARSSTEIQRNALVCVMLRLLEYYFGCLFLSSNRDAKSIDPAIASRITVMLSYPPLNVEGRAKVWKNLIELVPVCLDPEGLSTRKLSRYRLEFTTKDYETLADAFDLNGRQIKNSIVLARALAKERGVSLSLDILVRAVTAVAGESCHI